MSRLEVLSRWRSPLLVLSALAFGVWQATELQAVNAQLGDDTGLARFIAPVAIVLWLVCSAALLLPFLVGRRALSEDELTRLNRLTAFNWGYGITMLAVGAALVAATRTDWPAIDLVRLIFIAGVVAPLLRFALMERRTAHDD